jgi:hypothetical protein
MIAIWLSACAGRSENGPTILAGIDTAADGVKTRSSDPRPRAFDAEGPISLPYRGPGRGGVAYRLTLDIEGERISRGSSGDGQPSLVRETQTLEAAFRNLPIENAQAGDEAFLVGLDALRYTQKQNNPPADREVEIADDRLRIRVNDKLSVDNRANRVTGPLAPRIFLGRIFGVINHDPSGNPIKLSGRGAPAARQFMDDIPLLGAIAYAMVPLPEELIAAGSDWSGVRIPPSYAGALGLSVTLYYSLTGFETFEGVDCAMILLSAHVDENAVTSVTGHPFDRVQATLNGTAWVELENSLVRRVVLNDQIRASWSDSRDPSAISEYQIEHTTKLVLALRDPDEKSGRWADGTPKFKSR